MTLLVGVLVPCPDLDPFHADLPFEPGVVIVSDSRFTLFDSPDRPDDKGLKTGPLGTRLLAGFAGNVSIAERALNGFAAVIRSDPAPFEPQLQLQGFLRRAFSEAGTGKATDRTDLLLGVRSGAEAFQLWKLSNADNFAPQRRGGIESEGAGRTEFRSRIPAAIERESTSWGKRRNTYDRFIQHPELLPQGVSPPAPYQVDILTVAIPIASTVDSVIHSQGVPSVGGPLQTWTLSARGVMRVSVYIDRDGTGWKQASADPKTLHQYTVRPR